MEPKKNPLDNVTEAINKTASEFSNAIKEDIDKRNQELEAKALQEIEDYQRLVNHSILTIDDQHAVAFIRNLGMSPTILTSGEAKKIKKAFPIPVEQTLLWADCEIDLRANGVAITNKGVFFKTLVTIKDEKFQTKDNRKTSELVYIPWPYFRPESFTDLRDKNNKLLLVGNSCLGAFRVACDKTVGEISLVNKEEESFIIGEIYRDDGQMNPTVAAAPSALLAETEVLTRRAGQGNMPDGNGCGWMAEQANTIIDNLKGHNAKVVGNDNAKFGADRIVDGVKIQSKYCSSAAKSVNQAFKGENGTYAYGDMQLEVPADQYLEAIECMKQKILEGKVPGVTDPNEASNLIRKGNLTYQQAVNLTKAGTIESLTYDVATGTITSLVVFSISFVINTYFAYRKTRNMKQAMTEGALNGGKSALMTLISHVGISQLSRTAVFKDIISKNAIMSGAALSVATLVLFSIPETYRLATQKISGAQYTVNLISIGASVLGGYVGGVGATAIATAAGVTGLGAAAVSTGGALLVGAAAGAGAAFGASIIYEGDDAKHTRLFNAIASSMMVEYMFNEDDMVKFVNKMNRVPGKKFKKLYDSLNKSKNQEKLIREFLEPYFDRVAVTRPRMSVDDLETAFA